MLWAFSTNAAMERQSVLPFVVLRPHVASGSLHITQASAYTPHPNLLKVQTMISDMVKFLYPERAVSLITCL
jgi:hypothetical protein